MTKFCSQAPATWVFELSWIRVGLVAEPTNEKRRVGGASAVGGDPFEFDES